MSAKKKGKIYCVCNQAVANGVCDICPKLIAIKPYRTYHWAKWPRKVDKFKKPDAR